MSCYENLVMKTQMNYSRHYSTYASGGTAVVLSKKNHFLTRNRFRNLFAECRRQSVS